VNEVRLPELGENIETADVSAVLVAVGDTIARDQPVIEVETEKASLEIPADREGRIAEVRVEAGDTISIGQVIVVIESDASADSLEPPAVADRDEVEEPPDAGEGPAPEPVVEPRTRSTGQPARIGRTVPAAPSVRALARELGFDIQDVRGSGARGRITRDDVKLHAKKLIGGAGGRPAAAPSRTESPKLPDFGAWGEVTREPLTRIRQATARKMATAWSEIPHVTQFDRADITAFERLRKNLNGRPEAADVKLTLTARRGGHRAWTAGARRSRR